MVALPLVGGPGRFSMVLYYPSLCLGPAQYSWLRDQRTAGKPIPTSLIQSATRSVGRSSLTPRAERTSALPDLDDTARLLRALRRRLTTDDAAPQRGGYIERVRPVLTYRIRICTAARESRIGNADGSWHAWRARSRRISSDGVSPFETRAPLK